MTGSQVAARALARFLPADRREEWLADLDEEFLALSAEIGRGAANRWYARQVLRSIGPVLKRWVQLKLRATLPTEAPSIGQAFFAFAVTWFSIVALSVPLGVEPQHEAAAIPGEWRPSAVILEDGAVHFVYSLSDRPEEIERRPGPPTLFLVLALAPPAALFLGLLFALPVIDASERRRRAPKA
jgi:hypothetical protein